MPATLTANEAYLFYTESRDAIAELESLHAEATRMHRRILTANEGFESDEQRKAFFGKLAEGDIKGAEPGATETPKKLSDMEKTARSAEKFKQYDKRVAKWTGLLKAHREDAGVKDRFTKLTMYPEMHHADTALHEQAQKDWSREKKLIGKVQRWSGLREKAFGLYQRRENVPLRKGLFGMSLNERQSPFVVNEAVLIDYLLAHPNLLDRVMVANQFCATGAGGGVDPSCGKEGGGSGGAGSKVAASGKLKDLAEVGSKVAGVASKVASEVSTQAHLLTGHLLNKLPIPVHDAIEGAYNGLMNLGFASHTAVQNLAKRVSAENGITGHDAEHLHHALEHADHLIMTGLKGVALAGTHGMAHIAEPLLSIPVATTGYIAYSTAKNPLATARAATSAIKDVAAHVGKQVEAATRVEYKGSTAEKRFQHKPGVEQLGTRNEAAKKKGADHAGTDQGTS